MEDSHLEHVLIADGCCIQNADIRNSVIGLRSQISAGVQIRSSILMGNDYYDNPEDLSHSGIPLGIGANCRIEGAIIDKNSRIGENVTIQPFPPGTDIDTDTWVVRDGIVVIPKGTVLQSGTVIGPGQGKPEKSQPEG